MRTAVLSSRPKGMFNPKYQKVFILYIYIFKQADIFSKFDLILLEFLNGKLVLPLKYLDFRRIKRLFNIDNLYSYIVIDQ